MQTVDKVFINGVFVTPHGTKQSELENPATGEIITRVTLADEVDTQDAIRAANAAFKIYSQSSLQTRQEYLQWIHDAMAAKFDHPFDIISTEYGSRWWFSKFDYRCHKILVEKYIL